METTSVMSSPMGSFILGAGPLSNPAHDATDIADTLRTLGFRVTLLRGADKRKMLVNYYDPDDAGRTCEVRAFLLRANSDQLERGNTIMGFDPNTGQYVTEPGTGRSVGFVSIPEDIRSDASYYWVDLELVRNGLSCNPIAVG